MTDAPKKKRGRPRKKPIVTTPPPQDELAKYLYEQQRSRWLEEEQLRFYVPQDFQLPFHTSPAHRKLVHGGVRAGKTMAVVAHILWHLMGTSYGTDWATWHPEWVHDIKKPQYWRGCSDGMNESVLKVLVEWFRKMTPRFALEGERFKYSHDTHIIRLTNGSWIEFMSFDQEEGKASGRPLHGVWWDESHKCPEKFRKQCLNRLVDYHGEAIASCCPEDGITWEFEWYEKAQGEDPDYASFQFPTVENKFMYPGQDKTKTSPAIEQIKKDYGRDEMRLRVALHGDFIAVGGLIYPGMSETFHVKHAGEVVAAKQLPPFEDWSRFIGIDPAEAKAHAVLWLAVAPGGHMHIYRELLQKGTIPDLCRKIRSLSGLEHITAFYIDPHWDWTNLAARSVADGVTPLNFHEEFRKCGINLTKAPRGKAGSVDLGLDLVRRKLQVSQINLLPNLTFAYEVPVGLKHMRQYMYKPQKEIGDERKPSKVRDDLPDCVRILVTSDPRFEDSLRFVAPIHSDIEYDEYGMGF